MTGAEDAIDVDIDAVDRDLPYGWEKKQPYDTTVVLDSPDGQAEQVRIQAWGDEEYLVEPMSESELDGASAESIDGLGGTEPTLDDAVEEAVRIARLIA